jgi:hypothetical protein
MKRFVWAGFIVVEAENREEAEQQMETRLFGINKEETDKFRIYPDVS